MLWDLKALMCSQACFAEEYLDEILPARPIVPDPNKVIAHRMQTQIEHRRQALVPADLAGTDFMHSISHSIPSSCSFRMPTERSAQYQLRFSDHEINHR